VVSEDSFHFVPALSGTVHLLAQLKDPTQVILASLALAKQAHRFCEFGIAVSLAPYERETLEKWEHDIVDLRKSIDFEIPPVISRLANSSAAKGPLEQFQRSLVALRDVEGCGDFPSPGIVGSRPTDNHETPLAKREAGQEVSEFNGYATNGRPFLLIARTLHIFTVANICSDISYE
jgi:hypothetical protein